MAQRPGQSPLNSNWDNPFIPSFFNGTLNSPVASALSNNNGHGHFTSTNPSLFPGQEDHNISSGSHQDHTLQAPFSVNSVNGTKSKVEHQMKDVVEMLIKQAGLTKQKIQEEIMREVLPVVMKEIKAEILEEIKGLKADMKRLTSVVAEMEKLWTQWLSYQHRNPFIHHNNKTPQ